MNNSCTEAFIFLSFFLFPFFYLYAWIIDVGLREFLLSAQCVLSMQMPKDKITL